MRNKILIPDQPRLPRKSRNDPFYPSICPTIDVYGIRGWRL